MRGHENLVLGLWVLAVGGFAVAGIRGASATTSAPQLRAPEALATVSESTTPAAYDPASAAITIVERDVFRLDRRPAPVPFALSAETVDPMSIEASDFLAEPAYEPLLSLAGIIGGPPWEAILEGVPEHEVGLVVRQGDAVGELHIRYVGSDSVVVAGTDTTWTLTLKREWHP